MLGKSLSVTYSAQGATQTGEGQFWSSVQKQGITGII